MANVKRTIRLLVLTALSMTVAVPTGAQETAAAAQGPEPTAPTRAASGLLQIITEPSILALSPEVIDYLFQSSGVRDRAARQVLGVGAADDPRLDARIPDVQVLQHAVLEEPLNENRILLRLVVELPSQDFKPAAREFLAALVANFQQTIVEAHRGEMVRRRDQATLAGREVQQAEEELVETQKDLLAISQQDLSSATIRSNVTAITAQLQSLRLEQASKAAYRQAIQEQIARIREQMKKSLEEDEISAELQQVVERRMRELQHVQEIIKKGIKDPAGLNEVEDKLATARIDLARRREELGKTGSAGSLEQLTGELANLTLEAVQAQARERALEMQLKEAQELLPRAAEYERTMLKLEVAKRNMEEAMILHNKARQRLRMLREPSVSVIGG